MEYQLSNDVDVSKRNTNNNLILSENFFYPGFIDYRDFCLMTNNQGNTPHCVGYTIAGYFEIEYWKRFHIPKQISASKIYSEGRKYKADTLSGTRLEYCLEQLRNDDVFSGEIIIVDNLSQDVFKCITHEFGCLMCAFKITNEWQKVDKKNFVVARKHPKTLGGHCVLSCGYKFEGVYIQNSWGYENWGNYGFAILPWQLFNAQIQYCVYVKNLNLNKEKVETFIDA